jgi:Kef-type K+ transport system membrane component KefB
MRATPRATTVFDLARKALALAGLLAVVLVARHLSGPTVGASGALLALGMLLLAGDLAANLVERMGLPHLTGYLLAGLVVGPQVLGAVPHDAIESLRPMNTLALALIALSAGAELTWPLLTRSARSLGCSIGAQLLLVLPGCTGLLLLLRPFVPFLAAMGLTAAVGVAILWGVVAISRSPSATLGVISQLRPDGPLTRQTLTVVIAFDLVVLLGFAIARNVAAVLTEPGAGFSLSSLHELGVGILGSFACGTTLGLAIALYLRLVGRELILFLVLVGYGASEFTLYFHFEPMLLFITAGFVVANISAQGERLLEAVAAGGRVVYVIFFALAGAHLDLNLLARLWPVALSLAVGRAGLTFIAARLGSRWATDAPVVKTFGWLPLISQAGVTIGMAVAVGEEFPAFGKELAALIIAVVGLNEAVGPVLFKWALDRTGETGKARDGAPHQAAPSPASAPAR